MIRTAPLALAISLGLACAPVAHAWISFLDGSEYPELVPDTPWIYFSNEGSVAFQDLGAGNSALRMDSPAHSDPELPPDPGVFHANEYYTFRNAFGVPTENVGAARFRLVEFSPTGKENLLSVTVNSGLDEDLDGQPDGASTAPAITLVDGSYWVWSYTSNQPILELDPAVAGEFHEAYVMARNNGTAQVWWDGAMVLDGPVPEVADFADYVEFGSGTYWQTTAHTVVDFDWVGWGDITDMPMPPGIEGDYNEDGTVDAADYVVWRKTDGSPTGYDTWRAHFGETAAPAAVGLSTGAVPEPPAIHLLLMVLAAGLVAYRAR